MEAFVIIGKWSLSYKSEHVSLLQLHAMLELLNDRFIVLKEPFAILRSIRRFSMIFPLKFVFSHPQRVESLLKSPTRMKGLGNFLIKLLSSLSLTG